MLLWIVLGVMSAAVLAVVLRPLLRSDLAAPPVDPSAADIYRDQIREIEAERDQGLIADGEVEAARTEIARRLLAINADRPAATPAAAAQGLSKPVLGRLTLAIAALVPIAAVAAYLLIGAPDYPGQPFAERKAMAPERARIAELVRAVEARLRDHPEDGQGWDVLGPVYLKMGRFSDAADAFSNATRILGESPRRLAGFAEATVFAADGIVSEPARLAYEKLAALEPTRLEPRYWLALAKEQDGQTEVAINAYRALLADAPADATWRPMVAERIDALTAKLGKSPAPAAKAADPVANPPDAGLKGPTPEDIAKAADLPAADRQQLIENMVQGLADRLKKDGRDLAGWQRLIRAYSVMGRKSDAVAALGSARTALAGEPQSLAALSELARSLGLDG